MAALRTWRDDDDGVVDVQAIPAVSLMAARGDQRLGGQRRGSHQVAASGRPADDKVLAVGQPAGPGDVLAEREPGRRGHSRSASATQAAWPGSIIGNTASRLPSGEKAPPMAKPPGMGLRTVRAALVAVGGCD